MQNQTIVNIFKEKEIEFFNYILQCFVEPEEISDDLYNLVECLDIDTDQINYVISKFASDDSEVIEILQSAYKKIETNRSFSESYSIILDENFHSFTESQVCFFIRNVIANHLISKKFRGKKGSIEYKIALTYISNVSNQIQTAFESGTYQFMSKMEEIQRESPEVGFDQITDIIFKQSLITPFVINNGDLQILNTISESKLYDEVYFLSGSSLIKIIDHGDLVEMYPLYQPRLKNSFTIF